VEKRDVTFELPTISASVVIYGLYPRMVGNNAECGSVRNTNHMCMLILTDYICESKEF
jgi:hypothetical protein